MAFALTLPLESQIFTNSPKVYYPFNGSATIEVATANGSPPGVSGTRPIARVTYKASGAGTGQVSFAQTSALRDPENTDIALSDLEGARVEVR